MSRPDQLAVEHVPKSLHNGPQPVTMVNVLLTMIRDWPTTWRSVLLLVVAIGMIATALWFLPIELTAGPVTIRRVQ